MILGIIKHDRSIIITINIIIIDVSIMIIIIE